MLAWDALNPHRPLGGLHVNVWFYLDFDDLFCFSMVHMAFVDFMAFVQFPKFTVFAWFAMLAFVHFHLSHHTSNKVDSTLVYCLFGRKFGRLTSMHRKRFLPKLQGMEAHEPSENSIFVC